MIHLELQRNKRSTGAADDNRQRPRFSRDGNHRDAQNTVETRPAPRSARFCGQAFIDAPSPRSSGDRARLS
jgi:hypothetical protein